MSLATAQRALNFIFHHAPASRNIEIGFFGGEPLLEFPLLQHIMDMVKSHPLYDPMRVSLTITTNGTIFTDTIADFLNAHAFKVCVSCDGPPHVHNLLRRTTSGEGTSALVERTLIAAKQALPIVLVNAVYHPLTFRRMPDTVDYLSGLGMRHIYLNADYTAKWSRAEADELRAVYQAVADRYIQWYLDQDPHFVSLIDAKIAVLMRGGYHPSERCQMGIEELTISPDGGVYPCERLIGSGTDATHRIGSVDNGLDLLGLACGHAPQGKRNLECRACTMKKFCMNWCSCSNTFMTGYYDRVGPFLCASERAAVQTALDVFEALEKRLGPAFLHHLAGAPQWNSLEQRGEQI